MRIDKEKFYGFYLPIILFFIAFCWKLAFIGTRDICIDEPFTIFHAQQSVGDIIKLSTQNEPNPPLFMLLLHFWVKVFGISAYAVRILPLVFNAFTVVFIYLIGKKFFTIGSGLLASGLFILSTYHFYFALEARTYSLLSMATAASLFFFISIIRNPENRKSLIGLVVANVALIYSHYFGWFVIFTQFIVCFLYLKEKKILKTLLIAILLTGVTFIPISIIFIKQFFVSSKGTWVQPPSKNEYLNQLYYFLNTKHIFYTILTLILVGVLYRVVFNMLRRFPKEIMLVLLWWIIPYTIMFGVSAKVPMFINRYILFNSIGLYIFIAIAIYFLYSRIPASAITIFIMFLMFFKLEINSKEFYYREVQNSVNRLRCSLDKNSIVIIYPHWADLGFIYYFDSNIFKNTDAYDSLLKINRIFPVWHIDHAKGYLNKFTNNRILLFQDGSFENRTIFNYLDSKYQRVDSVFYPQCFMVSVFDPVSKDTTEK